MESDRTSRSARPTRRRVLQGAGAATLGSALAAPVLAVADAAPASTQGQVQNEQSFSQAQIQQMVAPIALYPDPLLTQILMASTYPLEVVEAARWSRDNPAVTGAALRS